MKFLEEIAKRFYERDKSRVRELCFVFPNRRSGLFFQRYLSGFIENTTISPAIFTIKDLVAQVSGIREADKIELLFILYKIYCKYYSTPESFDDFIYWGEIILNDFNDIDNYLVDPKKLYSNVKDLKDIDSDFSFLSQKQIDAIKLFWEGFIPATNSESKEEFVSLWSIMYLIYSDFKKELLEKNCGYEGLIFREVVGELSKLESLLLYRKVVFVGFNNLNSCEEAIFDYIKSLGVADFYWDFYGKMVVDNSNIASQYISQNIKRYPSDIKVEISDTIDTKFTLIPSQSSVSQAKIVSSLLSKQEHNIESAVVLPDESLLMPLLYSLPDSIKEVNVTMGYPLRGSALISLIESLLDIVKDNRGYYYKSVIAILKHSYVKRLSSESAIQIIEKINRDQIIYVQPSFIRDSDPFIALLFSEQIKRDTLCNSLEVCDLIVSIFDYIAKDQNSDQLEREFIFYARSSLLKIREFLVPMKRETLSKILVQMLNNISIPFKGEPLAGLQIMGLLETRLLDFDNIFICSVNEGILPPKSRGNSFIPYNLRRGFAMPVREHEDAISSYNFYRLISRAKNVTLLYDTRTDGLKSGEISRFVLQLKYQYNIDIKNKPLTFSVNFSKKEPICKKRDKSTILALNQLYAKNGESALSASSLNNYIDCPLKFYYSNIINIREETEVTQDIANNEFGTIFHNTMSYLYSDYKGVTITSQIVRSLLKDKQKIDACIDRSFEQTKGISDIKGYYLIVKRLINRYVDMILKFDLSKAPFIYKDSERRVFKEFVVSDNLVVNLKGFIDREDLCINSNSIEIIDYKTGKANLDFKDIGDLFKSADKSRNSVAFQMLFYSVLCDLSLNDIMSVYSLREADLCKSLTINNVKEKYESYLKELISQIFDDSVDFIGTNNKDICDRCYLKSICH